MSLGFDDFRLRAARHAWRTAINGALGDLLTPVTALLEVAQLSSYDAGAFSRTLESFVSQGAPTPNCRRSPAARP